MLSQGKINMTEEALQNIEKIIDMRECAEHIINIIHEPLVVLDNDLRIIMASRPFYEFFKITAENTNGRSIFEAAGGALDIPALRQILENIFPQNISFHKFQISEHFPVIGPRTICLNVRRIVAKPGCPHLVMIAIEDVTEKRQYKATEEKIHSLEIFQRSAVNREMRLIELKAKIRELENRISELKGQAF
jgi:PAS domain-containing protein